MSYVIQSMIEGFNEDHLKQINLIASENIISPACKKALCSDLANRYIMPDDRPKEIWEYPHQNLICDIHEETTSLARELYNASYADVRPLSGNLNVSIMLSALANTGESIFSISDHHGGHFTTYAVCKEFGINRVNIPFIDSSSCVDIKELKRLYIKHRVKLIFFDSSMILFSYPLKEIREALGDDVIIVYDASHVFGLIGAGYFQNPFDEGADIIMGSTHKSLFGPQKGMILCKEDGIIANKIKENITPNFVSSAHMHNIAALGIALEELKAFGGEYIKHVIQNAKKLASLLDQNGISVMGKEHGYTSSHQIHCTFESKEIALNHFKNLEYIGINLNPVNIPFTDKFGFRIGLCEVTRRGMQSKDMKQISDIIIECINGNDLKVLKQKVQKLSGNFKNIYYC